MTTKFARQQKLTVTKQCAGCDKRLFPKQLNQAGLCADCATAQTKTAVFNALVDGTLDAVSGTPVSSCVDVPVSEAPAPDPVPAPAPDMALERATTAQSGPAPVRVAKKTAPSPKGGKPALAVVKPEPSKPAQPKVQPKASPTPEPEAAALRIEKVDRTGVLRVMQGNRYLSYKQYNAGGKPGCVRTVKGGKYALYKADQAGLDGSDGAWATVCEQHKTVCNHRSLGVAERHLSGGGWCEACQSGGEVED